jgi:hypothetical protein
MGLFSSFNPFDPGLVTGAAPGRALGEEGLGMFAPSLGLGKGDVPMPTASGFKSIDDLIAQRTPEAVGLIEGGTSAAIDFSEQGQRAITDPLQRFAGLEAFGEQNALLGLSGQPAQEQAIAGIPVSQFTQELNRRQRETQLRQAVASGDVSGASQLAAGQLGAQQQGDIIQSRLGQLEPLVGTARGVRSTLSGVAEASRGRQANLLSGRGAQLGNIRLGASAPIINSIQSRAELSGLQGIASAGRRANTQNQLSSLAGTLAPQISSLFALRNPPPPSIVQQQSGFNATIPEAGFLMQA